MLILLNVLLVFLIFCSAFFSGSEAELFSLSPMKVKTLRSESDSRKRLVAHLLSTPRDLLITLIILNICMNILIQNVVASLFGDFSGWALNVGVPLVLTLVFGEVIPKSIGFANNETIAYCVAKPLYKAQSFLLPVRKVLLSITSNISRFMFFFLKKEKEISGDELRHALKTSLHYGVLGEDEMQLMRGYLNLQEETVKEFMRPREEILYFEIDEPLSKLVHLFVDQECTRIPICKDNLDHIIGIMTSGIFFLHKDRFKTSSDLSNFLIKPFFIPEATFAQSLLYQMYEKRESLAIVVDEYGSISGLISLEDLVEVVVGEIADRRDEKSRYTRAGEDVIIASGKLDLFELESIFDIHLSSENHMVTVGGWLTEQLGDIPKSGTKYVIQNLLFHVLSSDQKRVRRVYIRRLKK